MTTKEESAVIESLNIDHARACKRVQRSGDAEREAMRRLPSCPTYTEELSLRLDIAKARYEIAMEMMAINAIQLQITKINSEVALREAKERLWVTKCAERAVEVDGDWPTTKES